MNCIEVTNAIWSGVSSAETEAHLEVCSSCQKELEAKRLLIKNMSALVEVPKPSRPLLPDGEEIRRAVKHNRSRWWRKWLGLFDLGRWCGKRPTTD